MPRGIRFTPAQEDIVIAAYQRGLSVHSVAASLTMAIGTVRQILKRRGVPRRRGWTCSAVDETFFDKIDTREKAYFFGWMGSDGCNNVKRHCLQIKLLSSDIGLLRKLRSYIKHEGNINVYKRPAGTGFNPRGNEMAEWAVISQRLSDALVRLGCPARKSRILPFPTDDIVPPHLMADYLRGYVEGDGSFGVYGKSTRYIIGLLGNKSFIEAAAKTIETHTGVLCRINPRNKSDWFYQLSQGGRFNVITILDWLYRDCGDMFLERKYQTYLKMKAHYDSLPDQPTYDTETGGWRPFKTSFVVNPIWTNPGLTARGV